MNSLSECEHAQTKLLVTPCGWNWTDKSSLSVVLFFLVHHMETSESLENLEAKAQLLDEEFQAGKLNQYILSLLAS